MKEIGTSIRIEVTPEFKAAMGSLTASIANMSNTLMVPAMMMRIHEPWFVYAMGERVKPITYKDDRHDHIEFYCDLQHRSGGHLTSGTGDSLAAAIDAAWAEVIRCAREGTWIDSPTIREELGL